MTGMGRSIDNLIRKGFAWGRGASDERVATLGKDLVGTGKDLAGSGGASFYSRLGPLRS